MPKRIPKLMTESRYKEVDSTGRGLTQEEIDSGWHFCFDWDGLLIGPGMPEMKICICEGVCHDFDDFPMGPSVPLVPE